MRRLALRHLSRSRVNGLRRLVSAGVMVGSLAVTSVAGATTTSSVPYKDPSSVGYIGLCDAAGHQVTGGSMTARPFAWRAVSSVAAPAPYNDDWRTAILLAYQPQEFLTSSEWSGMELTASSRYTNPSHPMAAATTSDYSLHDVTEAYKPVWDNFYELRIYLGTKNAPPYETTYPTLGIQVTGSTWHAVGGGPVDCASGTSTSLESIVLPSTTTTTTAHGATTTTAASVTTTTLAEASSSTTTSSSPSATVSVVISLLALAALAVPTIAYTRRRAHGTEDASGDDGQNGVGQ